MDDQINAAPSPATADATTPAVQDTAAGIADQLPAGIEGLKILSVQVRVEPRPWRTDKLARLAGELISLREGESFRAVRFEQSLVDLGLSKRFEDIRSAFDLSAEGVRLTFELKPARVIKDIKTFGAYPLFTSDILKAMSVYAGDSLQPDTYAVQEKLLKEYYKREGFEAADIRISGRPDDTDGTQTLSVHIKPGRSTMLGRLSIKGNQSMSDLEILARMSSWRNSWMVRGPGRLRQEDFIQDVRHLRDLYWQRGYPECEIAVEQEKDSQAGLIHVVLKISEGPKTLVKFSGNRHIYAFRLKKALSMFKEGNRRDRGLRKDRELIRQFYLDRGYPFAEVSVLQEKITTRGRVQRIIEFHIEEGPHTKLGEISFSGNQGLESARLAQIMRADKRLLPGRNYYVADLLEDDLNALKAFYQRRGYSAALIEPGLVWNQKRTRVSISMHITEGVQTLIKTVRITGLSAAETEEARTLMRLRPGRPFSPTFLLREKDRLAEYIAQKGYPYVEVKETLVFSPDKTAVDIALAITPGIQVHMGSVYYRGNFSTRPRALGRELHIKPGDPFSAKTMLEGQKNIRDMGVFNNVQFKTFGLKEKKDTVTLLVDMEELKPYYLQAGAGYESTRGVYGSAKAGDRNLFGHNYHTWLSGEVSQIGYNGAWGISQQNILGTRIAASGDLSYERKEELNQNFGTKVGKATLGVSRAFEEQKIKTAVSLSYENREAYALNENADPDDIYAARGILIVTPSISFDKRDSFVRPSKGLYSGFSVDISHGLQQSWDNFLKYKVDLRAYTTPMRRLTLACLGRMGYIETLGKDSTLPDDQLLYLGGTFSVRGYGENMLRFDANDDPVGGLLALSGSLEARYEFTRSWEATLFYDTGAIRRAADDFCSDAFRSSYGLGLRYITPIGPMGLLYGRKIGPREDEGPGRFHFSLGYTF